MLKSKVQGIIFSNMHDEVLGNLTARRTTGSVPFGGRYRFIDFTLSNMVNAGIFNVGVITKSNYKSLMEHLGSGRDWGLARKLGGLTILPPFSNVNSGMYRGRVEALAGALDYIKNGDSDYVIMADCDVMGNLDYEAIIDAHIREGADITVAYLESSPEYSVRSDTCAFLLDDDSRVKEVLIQPQGEGRCNLYMNVAVMSVQFLERMVRRCLSRNQYRFSRDVLQADARRIHIYAYQIKEPAVIIDNLATYMYASMKMLDPKLQATLFPAERPIYTRVRDEAPVRYGIHASARNCLIADGAIIEGDVENCIIFRNVKIGRGAKVRNSVIMQDSVISDGAQLDWVIADRQVAVKDNRVLAGYKTHPFYLEKNTIV